MLFGRPLFSRFGNGGTMIEVRAEYLTLPDRRRKTETVTIEGNKVGFTTVVKALTGLDATGCFLSGWYYRPSQSAGITTLPAVLTLTKLRIKGSNVTIGKERHEASGWLFGEGFEQSDELTEVEVDADSCVIGADSFQNCKSLKKVVLTKGGQSIGDHAFYNCEQLESVVLPDSITSIGDYAFSGCQSLNDFIFPSRLRKIGESAFGKTRLQAAMLPSSVSSIGPRSFSSCKWLRYAVIPSTFNMNRFAGESFPFMDCDYKRLVIVCDQTDYENNPDSRFGDDTLAFSKGLRYRWMTTPNTIAGVQALFHSRAVTDECRDNAREIAQSAPIGGKFSAIEQDMDNVESLRKYLKLISEAETAILQLTESLALAESTKKRLQTAVERRHTYDMYKDMVDAVAERSKTDRERQLHDQKRRDIAAGKNLPYSITSSKPSIDPRNTPEPERPAEPAYQKPGLFNRKKVEARNAELEKQYRERLAHYETLMNVRRRMIANYDEKLAAWEQERKECIQRQLEELGTFEASSTVKADGNNEVTQELETASAAADAMCTELEARLSEASGLLKLAYSADIIFPKYRNLEAMTTMWEYFETGRCDSLQGPNGAYNLYESEVRSDAIINKLDIVSDKLDVISDQLSAMQANQYALYVAVEGIGTRLDSMSSTLDSVLQETRATKSSVLDLGAKAATLVRNSSEIAYWSKKNAELTDSLGYLIAFTAM